MMETPSRVLTSSATPGVTTLECSPRVGKALRRLRNDEDHLIDCGHGVRHLPNSPTSVRDHISGTTCPGMDLFGRSTLTVINGLSTFAAIPAFACEAHALGPRGTKSPLPVGGGRAYRTT